MGVKTPRLDLYQADPVADENETFNIETMLNANWRKIDEKVVLKEEADQQNKDALLIQWMGL